MSLSKEARSEELVEKVVQAFDNLNGVHPGFRPAHAKGVLLGGTFTPTKEGANLTRAPHLHRESTPVSVRFSDFAGIPVVPDNAPEASPRGMAIRFHLAEHVHTDIVAHSTDGFPVRTGEEFVEFLTAVRASGPDAAKPTPIEQFLGSHPAALEFVMTPKPIPVSFSRECFFSATAYQFIAHYGSRCFVRYRIRPAAGASYLTSEEAAAKGPNFLFEEITTRDFSTPIEFRVAVQVAEAGDVTDDATVHWPAERREAELGTLQLNRLLPVSEPQHDRIIFDPLPRVDGIEPSADPLLSIRGDVYLATGRRRRAAQMEKSVDGL